MFNQVKMPLLFQVLGGLTIFQDLVRGASQEVRALYKPWHVALGMTTLSSISVY